MTTRIQLRRGTAAQWTDADPTLALGEAGIETDTLLWKVGDGVTSWSELPYMESADKDFGNVTVTGNITTGNIKTNGYYFANGTPVPFGVTYGNSNVATFLAAYGSNTISTTGNVTSGNFLTSGVVSATGNITGNYFLGNGSQLTGISSTTNALINGDNSFVLDVNGNVVFEGDGAGQAVNRGLVWDYGAVANGVNSQVRQDNDGLTVQAWTENSGNYAASVNIVTNQDANTNT